MIYFLVFEHDEALSLVNENSRKSESINSNVECLYFVPFFGEWKFYFLFLRFCTLEFPFSPKRYTWSRNISNVDLFYIVNFDVGFSFAGNLLLPFDINIVATREKALRGILSHSSSTNILIIKIILLF